jgi:hypothetical protein
MIVLDENVPTAQREALRRIWIAVRQIGIDAAYKGVSDEDIIPLLHHLKRPTFVTRDEDFFRKELRHARYCLVWLAVEAERVAEFTRRVLRHPELNTQAKRMGTVLSVSPTGVTVWRLHAEKPIHLSWPTRRRK